MEKDKILHMGYSAFITTMMTFVLIGFGFGYLSVIMGAEIALIIGLGKELFDSKTGGVNDPLDVKADLIGIVIGAIIGAGGFFV